MLLDKETSLRAIFNSENANFCLKILYRELLKN